MAKGLRLTEEEYRQMLWRNGQQPPPEPEPQKPRSKFRSERETVDGRTFHSKFEAAHYIELRAREAAGEIRNLACQVEYAIVIGGVLITTYRADFVYDECNGGEWSRVVSDTKSDVTRKLPEYQIKRKLMFAVLGIAIREVIKPRHKQV